MKFLRNTDDMKEADITGFKNQIYDNWMHCRRYWGTIVHINWTKQCTEIDSNIRVKLKIYIKTVDLSHTQNDKSMLRIDI